MGQPEKAKALLICLMVKEQVIWKYLLKTNSAGVRLGDGLFLLVEALSVIYTEIKKGKMVNGYEH
ncbi:Uncharacterised protein [Mycobacteroides abscessus subsp. abscessus]|nr:hypothetical protein B14911_20145 [Bacillus sp. NRRL B-14911]SIC56174.1 Uncharacterised protein [Mycobacteroides abscessus subsp. abscessus]